MSSLKVVLVDADGVVITPNELFSYSYCRENNLDDEGIQTFFKEAFSSATRGESDLKDLIVKYNDAWKWSDDPQLLLDMWFHYENVVDSSLLKIIEKIRESGVPVFLATQQERYRANYLKDVMFPDAFDGFFISCEIGHNKTEPEYWEKTFALLKERFPHLLKNEIVLFDDSQNFIATAQKAGIATILYKNRKQVEALADSLST